MYVAQILVPSRLMQEREDVHDDERWCGPSPAVGTYVRIESFAVVRGCVRVCGCADNGRLSGTIEGSRLTG